MGSIHMGALSFCLEHFALGQAAASHANFDIAVLDIFPLWNFVSDHLTLTWFCIRLSLFWSTWSPDCLAAQAGLPVNTIQKSAHHT